MRITRDRMVNVLGPAPKPTVVWQEQFDYNDEVLREMARLDWHQIGAQHLSYYFLDLAYGDLQPDLFRHVFPACLKYWYETLMRNESTGFHSALIDGEIVEKMLSEPERQSLNDFFADGFLDRIEAERSFVTEGKSANWWILRFNSLAIVAPVIRGIWNDWWSLDHPGKAVTAVMYASGLVYFQDHNPISTAWMPARFGGPYLTSHDSGILDRAWRADNIAFLRETLTFDYITGKLDQAASALFASPDGELAARVASDARTRADFIEIRIHDLLELLTRVKLAKAWE